MVNAQMLKKYTALLMTCFWNYIHAVAYDMEHTFSDEELLPLTLEEIYQFMNSAPEHWALLEGYTDIRGAEHYNIKLSRRRAEAVAEYLVLSGISRERLVIEARGAVGTAPREIGSEEVPEFSAWRIVEVQILPPETR